MKALSCLMELFFRRIPKCTAHQRKSPVHFKTTFILSVIIIHDTKWRICYIINDIPTTFWLMQRFEVTFINKFMVWILLIVYRLDWTCTYIQSIINFSNNSFGTPLLSFCFQYCYHSHKNWNTWGILGLIYICFFRYYRWELSI